MRTGCQWNALSKESGDGSSAHRTLQRWIKPCVLQAIWGVLLEQCEKLGEVNWDWQAGDGAMGKARLDGNHVGPNPTERDKNGTERSAIVGGDGGPLGVVVAPANVHDCKLLRARIEAIVVPRPDAELGKQHLCLDKGYDNATGERAVKQVRHMLHYRRNGEESIRCDAG